MFLLIQRQLESADTSTPTSDECTTRLQRHISGIGEISSASSAADLPCGLPVTATSFTDYEVAPDQLRDAFVGDLQYVDERFHDVQVAVFHSSSSTSSSSSSASDTEHTNITEVPVPHTPVHTSLELSAVTREVRKTTDTVNTTTKVESDRAKMFQRISEDRRVTTCDDQVRVYVH